MYALKEVYPDVEDKKIYNFIIFYLCFASGLYPVTQETEVQKEAIKLSATNYVTTNFEETFKETILIYLKNLK